MDKARGKKWPERRCDYQTGHRHGERQAVRDAKLRDETAGIAGEGESASIGGNQRTKPDAPRESQRTMFGA
jgi:hypothetical protein